MEGAGKDATDREVIIRKATHADMDALTDLRPPRGLHVDRIPADGSAHYVIAEIGARPVGFGVVHFRGDPLWERPRQAPLVMDLWVAPELRSRGIGRKVLAALEAAARQRGFPCVYVQVQLEKNPRALALYRKLGYQKLQARECRDPYHEVDEHGNVREGVETIVDLQKWL